MKILNNIETLNYRIYRKPNDDAKYKLLVAAFFTELAARQVFENDIFYPQGKYILEEVDSNDKVIGRWEK